MTARFHLVGGPIAAGKTTYARKLAQRANAVRFSIDEWMMSLFGPDIPATPDPEWIFARVKRSNAQILNTALEIAAQKLDVVLDLGFITADERSTFAKAARSAGYEVKLHWLILPAAERWARVEARNTKGGTTYSFVITRQMFEFMEARVAEPDDEEMQSLNGISVAS